MNEYFFPPAGKRRVSFVDLIVAAGILLFLVALLFPAISGEKRGPSGVSAVRNDVSSIVASVKQFQIEYGHFPSAGANGLLAEAADNVRLFNILRALDPEANPKQIVFIDGKILSAQKGRLAAGFDPSGTFLDHWGNPYLVAFDADNDGTVANPYKDGDRQLRTTVVAWSLGPDGVQAERLRDGHVRADDIVSWQ